MSNNALASTGTSKTAINLLITDLDNTLYDWFEFWYRSFSAMLQQIAAISGIDAKELEPEIKKVHERHGTSEYAFLIEELPPLLAKHQGQDLREIYEPAISAYRRARTESLVLYPTVLETLTEMKQRGSMVVAYTESLEFYVSFRQECMTALRWSLAVVPLQVLQEQSEKFLRAYLSNQIRGCLDPLLFAH